MSPGTKILGAWAPRAPQSCAYGQLCCSSAFDAICLVLGRASSLKHILYCQQQHAPNITWQSTWAKPGNPWFIKTVLCVILVVSWCVL